jgi:hypothetical protein
MRGWHPPHTRMGWSWTGPEARSAQVPKVEWSPIAMRAVGLSCSK